MLTERSSVRERQLNLTSEPDKNEWAERQAISVDESTGEWLKLLKEVEESGLVCPLLWTPTVDKSDIYEIQFGTGRRGTLTYSAKEIEEKDRVVAISIGE